MAYHVTTRVSRDCDMTAHGDEFSFHCGMPCLQRTSEKASTKESFYRKNQFITFADYFLQSAKV